MPISYNLKKKRDAEKLRAWDQIEDDHFVRLGFGREALKNLQVQIQGKIVFPGDPDYDKDRMIANPIFDYYPAVIVYCQVEADVAACLYAARSESLPFEIRSGGHCTAGFSSGPGILIDVSNLNGICIDPSTKTATVGTGVTFGDFNKQLAMYGLHVPGGECPDVCIGGYVQGGGYGFTSCTYGMSCDNIISMTVMLADGSVVRCDASQNYDLWWAMRGGTGGNFGVLLSITYRLVALGACYGFALIWPLSSDQDVANAAEAMMVVQQDYTTGSQWSPYLTLQVSLSSQSIVHPGSPEGELLPYLLIRGLWAGDPAEGPNVIAALQNAPGCITQWTKTAPYIVLNTILLDYPQEMPPIFGSAPLYEYKASRYVSTMLQPSDWTKIFDYFKLAKPNAAYGYLEFYGGQIDAWKPGDNAFVHRNVLYNSVMDVFFSAPTGQEEAEAKAFLDGWKALMAPYWNGQIYQNYCELGQQNYEQAYWGAATTGLSMVKGKYDPSNFFTFAQQVPMPTGDETCDWTGLEALKDALAAPINYEGGARAAT